MTGRDSTTEGNPPVYLDYQATTPVDPRVLEAMLPYFNEKFGNPHSVSHAYGWEAEAAVEKARRQIADLIGADDKEIVFTSGATEANNLAIKGVAHFYRQKRNHVVTVATEHKCVIESCRRLEREGFALTWLPVGPDGLLDLDALRDTVTDRTVLVSIMAANNEIGVIQPLAEIGAICRERGAFFHTDVAQAVGKFALDVDGMKIDLLSISGHKIYAPKGVGALYIRRRPRVRIEPMMDGGGQERGFRSGTVATQLAVGLGEASAICGREMADEDARLGRLRDKLHVGITAGLGDVLLNGSKEVRLSNNLNVSFLGVDADALITNLKDLAISTGSACTSASVEPSYVLQALGLGDERARASVRFSVGRPTTDGEIDYAIERVVAEVSKLRAGTSKPVAAAR